jgi:adenylate cyclase
MKMKLSKFIPGPWSIAWVTVTAAFLVALKIADPTPVESIRLKGFDTLLASDSVAPSAEVVVVDIGEPSIERYGQWPWPRQDLARVIGSIQERGAATIVLPVIMSERDRLGGDKDLAFTLSQTNTVIAQAPTTQNKKPDAVRRGVAIIGGEPLDWVYSWPGALAPYKPLAEVAAGVGTSVVAPEVDGVTRRMPLIVAVDGEIFPSLPLEALRVATGQQSYQVKMSPAGVDKVRIKGQPVISTDANARIWLRWNKSFTRYELSDLQKNKVDFRGKIVVLGLAVEGLGGIIATPRGEHWAHDIQAQTVQTLLDGDSPVRPAIADTAELAGIVGIALMLIVLVPRLPIWAVAVLLAVTVGGVVGGSVYAWREYAQLWDIYYLTLSAIVLYGHALFARFVKEFLQKQQIKKQFGTYLSPALVAQLQKNPEKLTLGGDERELSIMFTDVRGFTSISEHYGTNVQGLTQIMNRYMTAMTAKILENNGTLDKYIGDAQMAFWNAPLEETRHAHMAVKTALEMLGSLDAFNEEVSKEGVPPFGMGLGINTSVVVVGNMGSDQRFDYTCLGDGVNLASRLEGQSKPYGVRLVLGQRTAELVRNDYPVIELDCIAVKGKNVGVKIYTIGKTDRELHDTFLELYYKGTWSKAKTLAQIIIDKELSDIPDYYRAMIERFNDKANHPKTWDGVWRATSK